MNHSEATRRAEANLRRLICIRMFFNARFYYPIFALFFLEHGLSWVDFGILNGIWAATIILLEVPSGALADTIGRKKLIVFSALCMILEMLALILAPMDGSLLVFSLFALNRIISGVAEAAVSGADEALVYDSFKSAGREKDWSMILAKVQRFTSLAFFFAMMTGSAFYDPAFVNGFLEWMGIAQRYEAATLVKVPVFLTLISSFVVLFASLGMSDEPVTKSKPSLNETLRESIDKTKEAALWIWGTPLPFAILLASMVLDNVVRQFLTIGAAYWKVIQLPLATFGLVAACMSLMGFFVPYLAKILADKRTPRGNFFLLSVVLIIGLLGIREVIPYWGILPATLLYFTM
ncbi:MAG: MFS transporter, partial [Verrucomicrobiota bacterium]|nr:MFS transporter [Verrucomicrobiota bacterium]